jgi:hypothetical protein
MSTENILDENYQIIGVIYNLPGGVRQIRNANGTQILGTYHPGTNRTIDSRGQPIGSGDQLNRLLGRSH